jgi:hypothetical protein
MTAQDTSFYALPKILKTFTNTILAEIRKNCNTRAHNLSIIIAFECVTWYNIAYKIFTETLMKRFTVTVCILIACAILFTACADDITKNDKYGEFFADDLINAASLKKIPKPSLDGALLRLNTLYLTLEDAEYGEYLNSLLTYLSERTDIYYLSTVIGSNLDASRAPGDICKLIDSTYQPDAEKSITFVFSKNRSLGSYREMTDPTRIIIKREEGTVEKTDHHYNVTITVSLAKDRLAYVNQ